MFEKNIHDYWNVDGERELSDAWTGFTRLFDQMKGHLMDIQWSGEETDEETNDLKTRQCGMCDAAKGKAKQKWAIEKPKLDNARQVRGIFFIEPQRRRIQAHNESRS